MDCLLAKPQGEACGALLLVFVSMFWRRWSLREAKPLSIHIDSLSFIS